MRIAAGFEDYSSREAALRARARVDERVRRAGVRIEDELQPERPVYKVAGVVSKSRPMKVDM